MTTLQASFLLISDDVLLARALTNALAPNASLHVFSTADQALALLKSTRSLAGIVIDESAVSEGCVRAVSKLRAARPLASLLFVTARLDVALINELQALRVQMLARPLPADALAHYAERALAGGRVTAANMQDWVARFSADHRLSASDRALIPVILADENPDRACHRLGLDRAALERGLRRVIKKCRVRNTDRLTRNLWRDALLFSREETSSWLESPKLAAAV